MPDRRSDNFASIANPSATDDTTIPYELLDHRERARRIATTVVTSVVIVALILAAYAASPDDITALGDGWVRLVVSLAIVAGAITVAVRSVMQSPYPILRAVETIIAVVCLAVVIFASMYLAISVADADAFTEPLDHTSAIYFATTTATTVGFGDISPASDPARIVVMCQMATNVIVIGVGARLLLGTARRRSGI